MVRSIALGLTVLTGFSGLVYQVAWQKYLATLLGSHSEATCAVLGIFLGGLSLGYALFGRVARRLATGSPDRDGRARLLMAYGLVEAGIGLYALAFPWLFQLAGAVSLALPHGAELLAFGLDVLLTALLIGPPTVLMGGTIPLLTQGLSQGVEDATRFHSMVYGFNTAGAFVGALAAGFVLVPTLGLVTTVRAMGVVNLVAGGAFVALRHRESARSHAPAAEAGTPPDHAVQGLPTGFVAFASVALLAGFAMMTLQTTLNRVGALALGASHFTFAMVVATFVLCIALGSLAVSALRRIPAGFVAVSQWMLVACLILVYPLVEDLPYWAHILRIALHDAGLPAFYGAVFCSLLALVVLPLGLSGALLPLLFHEVRRERADLGDTAGRLYAWNTVGSLLGALVGGYLLLFWIDLHATWRIATLALAGGAALLTAHTFPGRRMLAAGGFATVAVALALLPPWSAGRMSAGLFRSPYPAESFANGPDAFFTKQTEGFGGAAYIRFQTDDPGATITVRSTIRNDGLSIATNGKSDGNTPGDDPTVVLLGLLPALFAEQCERAFVIGWGTGITVGELAALEKTREVVVAEVSPGVMEAAPLFEDRNRRALANPKARVLRRDAYRALLHSEGLFDVIVSEPSNPWTTGIELLFSLEFLQAARARLSDGGVYAQWFHTYETDDASIELVLRTYRQAFDEVAVWRSMSGDLILLGFADASRSPDLATLEARFARSDFGTQLAERGFTSLPRLLAHEVMPLGVLHALPLDGPTHTLLHPILSDLAARAFYRKDEGHLPVSLDRDAAAAGARHSWLRRYRAAHGLSDEERRGVLEEACKIDLYHCATLFAQWRHDEPDSEALAESLAAARSDATRAPALEGKALDGLAALFGENRMATGIASFELARDLAGIYTRYYHHAAPFPAAPLHSVWERCAETDARCARELPRVHKLGVATPHYSRRG